MTSQRWFSCSITWLALATGAAACGGGSHEDPTARDVSTAIGTAGTIGYIATLSLDGPTTAASCVHASAACTTYPCDATLDIDLGGACPTPLASTASATVHVTGHWTRADEATLQLTSVTAAAGAHTVALVRVRDVTVMRDGTTTTVQYQGSDADVGNGNGTTATSASWSVAIDSRGTPDAGDDRLTISGSSQAATSLSGSQVGVTDVVVDPTQCSDNPISGSMTLQSAGLTSIRQDRVTFHATCDGTADLQGVGGASTLTLTFVR